MARIARGRLIEAMVRRDEACATFRRSFKIDEVNARSDGLTGASTDALRQLGNYPVTMLDDLIAMLGIISDVLADSIDSDALLADLLPIRGGLA